MEILELLWKKTTEFKRGLDFNDIYCKAFDMLVMYLFFVLENVFFSRNTDISLQAVCYEGKN